MAAFGSKSALRPRLERLEHRRLLAAAPVAVDDKYTVLAGEMLVNEPGVLGNDYDSDGDELTAVLVGAPQFGAVALAADGGFRYLPNPGFQGEDSFIYRARAAGQDSSPTTVTVTTKASSNFDIWSREFGGNGHAYAVVGQHLPWNEARLAAELVIFGGSSSHLTSVTSAAEADQILLQRAARGGAWLGGHQVRTAPDYAEPAGGWRWSTGEPFEFSQWMPGEPNDWPGLGSEDFLETLAWGDNTFLWNDVHSSYGYGGYSVEAPDSPTPFAGDDMFQVAPGEPRLVEAPGLLANDRYGRATVTVEPQTELDHGTLEFSPDGAFVYVPDAGFIGIDSFVYRLTTADGVSNLARCIFKVGIDEYPTVATGKRYSTDEDRPIVTNGVAWDRLLEEAFDRDATQLRVEIVTPPLHGQLELGLRGNFVYTPNLNYFGDDEFTFVVFDGPARSAPTKASISVTFVNDSPVASPDRYELAGSASLDVSAEFGVLANDIDPDLPLIAELVGSVAHGALELNADGAFTYAPQPGFRGVDRFTYQAFDYFERTPATSVLLAVDVIFGDANGDGFVDLNDFGALKTNFGHAGASLAQGDLDGDGDVDLDDFGLLKENFGRTAGGALAIAPVESATGEVRALGWLRWTWERRSGKPETDGER